MVAYLYFKLVRHGTYSTLLHVWGEHDGTRESRGRYAQDALETHYGRGIAVFVRRVSQASLTSSEGSLPVANEQ